MLATSWKKISYNIFIKINKKNLFICNYSLGEIIDLETILYIKESSLFYGHNNLKSIVERNKNISTELINEDFDFNYIFNLNKFKLIKNIFLFNLNLRVENAILNAKLRQKLIWERTIKIYFIGSKYNLTYKYIHIGISTRNLLAMVEGNYFFYNFLKKNYKKNNLLLFSSDLKVCYKNEFSKTLFNLLNNVLEINYLARSASSVGSMDLSFSRYIKKKKSLCNLNNNFEGVFFNIGYNYYKKNNLIEIKKKLAHKTFIYQNNKGDNFTLFMDFFLPTYSFFEKNLGFFINCLGILRKTRQVLLPRNFFAQDNIDVITLVQKILYKKNKNIMRVKNLYSYIPLNLFLQRRITTFFINENKIQYTLFYFYIFSNKNKNSYKSSYITLNSVNLNILSKIHYNYESNLSL